MVRPPITLAFVLAAASASVSARAQPSPEPSAAELAAKERDAFLGRSNAANGVLAGWSAASIATGAIMFSASDDPFVQGMAIQHVVWGGIDAVIAGIGMVLVQQQRGADEPIDTWIDRRDTAQTVFWVNMALDVAYMAAGGAIWIFSDDRAWQGTGAGVVTQGAFLFGFDAAAAMVMRR